MKYPSNDFVHFIHWEVFFFIEFPSSLYFEVNLLSDAQFVKSSSTLRLVLNVLAVSFAEKKYE